MLLTCGLTDMLAQTPVQPAQALDTVTGRLGDQPGIKPVGPVVQPVQPGGQLGFISGASLAKPVMAALDLNKDGKVSKEEFMAAAEKFYKECDKDNAGKIDEKAMADNLTTYFMRKKKSGDVTIKPVPLPPVPVPPVEPGAQPPIEPVIKPILPPTVDRPNQGTKMAKGIIRRTGTDKMSKVSLERFKAAADTLFRECDMDKNGSLDEKEIAAGIDLLLPFGAVDPGVSPMVVPSTVPPVPPVPPGR
jgi:hypothetical protein